MRITLAACAGLVALAFALPSSAQDTKAFKPWAIKFDSKNLDVLVKTGQYGTYHMVCKEPGTRYDIAAGIVEIVGRKDIEMQRVKSDFFSQRFHAPRPPNEILVNKALEDLGINLMPTWREAFEEYIPRHFPHLMSR